MVLFKTALIGVALLILGVVVMTSVAPNITIEVQEVHWRTVEPHAEFLVGDTVDRSYALPQATSVTGTVFVTEAPSNQTSDISFLVFDLENYQRWNKGGLANALYSRENQGQFNFTFKTESASQYYFVFDNRASVFKKYVVFTLGYDETTTKRVPDTRFGYVGWGLAVIGATFLAYGLLRKPRVTWA
jgi:hypothetical protein